jgi:RimJ/RimL family protein N-acetyltransferase
VGETFGVGAVVKLRPIVEADLPGLLRLLWEPDGPGEYQWFGFRMDDARELERRWRHDGLIGDDSSYLAVEDDDGACAGWVTWRRVGTQATFEIGIALFPEHRGRGVGTEAQRQLVSYLFATTPVYRLQAGTEVDNIAERRALETVGFAREGLHRGVYFRDGRWRDSVMFGLLRDDPSHDDNSEGGTR